MRFETGRAQDEFVGIMTEKFAVRWWVGCWAALALAFLFGFSALPRSFNFSAIAALIIGGLFGALSIAPIVYLAIREAE